MNAGDPAPKSPRTDIAVRTLFGLAVGIVALGILAALTRQRLVYANLSVQGTLSDLPLLIGLMILFYGNYNYYARIIEPLGEGPGAALFSLFGMVVMVALPVVLAVEALKPMRYFVLTAYGALIAAKNYGLRRRFRDVETAALFRAWSRRAVAQTAIGLAAGAIFYVLMDIRWRAWAFNQLIECADAKFRPSYEPTINLAFNIGFLLMIGWRFITGQRDLDSLERARATASVNTAPSRKT